MAKYKITFLPKVIRRDFRNIPKRDVQKIMSRIGDLADEPRPNLCKKLSGREEYRIRQGNYRVLYIIKDEIITVTVVAVGHRKDIY